MSKKKKRIRRKKPRPPELPESTTRAVYRNVFKNCNWKIELPTLISCAEELVDWARAQKISPETFLLTEPGEKAMEIAYEVAQDMVDSGEALLADEPVPSDVRRLRPEQHPKASVMSCVLGSAGTLWETVFHGARGHKSRTEPYDNEHVFHFLSTATFRYQFMYRCMDRYYSDDPQFRHIVSRFFPSPQDAPEDRSNDKITTYIMTELWMSGVNEFKISSDLRDRFLMTDIGDISIDSINFPYPAFMVTTPEENIMFSTVEHEKENARVWCFHNLEKGVVQLNEKIGESENLADLWGDLPEDFWDNCPPAEKASKEAFTIVCNLILYLQTKNAEVKSNTSNPGSKPPVRKKRKLKDYAKKEYTPINHTLYPSLSDSTSEKAASHSSKREHWVRGHYRWQPYWPEGRDNDPTYERIWIEPHLRGSKKEDDSNSDMNPRKYNA